MKKIFLGNSPNTSIAGLILAGLYAFQTAMLTPPVHILNVCTVIAIAILGRLCGDSTTN